MNFGKPQMDISLDYYLSQSSLALLMTKNFVKLLFYDDCMLFFLIFQMVI